MYIFKSPSLLKMSNTHLSLELTEEVPWESFNKFSRKFSKQINAKLKRQIVGLETRFWDIEVNNEALVLIYRGFPLGISIESDTKKGDEILTSLYEVVKNQSKPDGI